MPTIKKVWEMSTEDIDIRITEIEHTFNTHEAMDWEYFMSKPALTLRNEWEDLNEILCRRADRKKRRA